MNTTDTAHALTTIDRWLLPHAAAITSFADANPIFALTLARIIAEECWSKPTTNTIYSGSVHLVPEDASIAEDILDWLMYELATHPEARTSRQQLMIWAEHYEAPQDLIWGLALTDTFGPTVTGQPEKKKLQSTLRIVISRKWQESQDNVTFTQTTQALSQQLIATELRKAGGKIGSLHPDTAEWCMGNGSTTIQSASTSQINTLHRTAKKETLHHHLYTEDEQVVAIAISPSVRDTLVKVVA